MLLVVGTICWVAAWAIALKDRPVAEAIECAIASWLGLVYWEFYNREHRKLGKGD